MPPEQSSPSTPITVKSGESAQGLTWLQILGILCLAIVVITASGAYWSYHSGLVLDVPAEYYFLPLFLGAYFVGGLTLVALPGRTSHWLRLLAVLGAFVLNIGLVFHEGREDWYLRGLAEAFRHADLEPVKRWADTYPAKVEDAQVNVEPADVPDEVWRAVPFKGNPPFFKFVRSSKDGGYWLTIYHTGSGFVRLSGLFLTSGEYTDPRKIGITHHAQLVSPNVWVIDGG